MRRLVVDARARAELLEAIEWSKEHRDAGFANRLAGTVREALVELTEHPLMWPVAKGDPRTRPRHLLAIRYTVFYRVSADAVMITGIRHMRRRPRARKPAR